MNIGQPSAPPRHVRVLLGHVDQATGVAMLQGGPPTAPGAPASDPHSRWSAAAAARRTNYQPPNLGPLPGCLHAAAQRVAALPEFTSGFPSGTAGWAEVELAQLRSYQPTINLSQAGTIADDRVASLPDQPTPADLFAVSAPDPKPAQIDVHYDAAAMAFTVTSANPNIRVVGPGGNPQQGLVGFVLGHSSPWMTVARYRDLYILRDGYHRGVALLNRGIHTMPMLVVECASYNETGGLQSGFLPEAVVCGSAPPVLGDFLDPTITADVIVPAVKRVIRLRPDTFLASA